MLGTLGAQRSCSTVFLVFISSFTVRERNGPNLGDPVSVGYFILPGHGTPRAAANLWQPGTRRAPGPHLAERARVSLRRSFTSAAVTITTGARESWRRLGAGGQGRRSRGAGRDQPPRARPALPALPGAPLHADPRAGGCHARRRSSRPRGRGQSLPPSRGASGQGEPLNPDSMAPGERAGATVPPTTSRNPSASRRKEGAPGAAGPRPGAQSWPPRSPRGMAGR